MLGSQQCDHGKPPLPKRARPPPRLSNQVRLLIVVLQTSLSWSTHQEFRDVP